MKSSCHASTNTPQALPTFAEIADMRCQEASNGTKTVNIKIAINTARMMVEAEIQERKNYRLLVAALKDALAIMPSESSFLAPTVNLLQKIGEIE